MKDVSGRLGSILLVLIGVIALTPTTFYTLIGLLMFGALAIEKGLNSAMLGAFSALLIPASSLGCLFWLTIRHRHLRLRTIPKLVWISLTAGVLTSVYMSLELGLPTAEPAQTWFVLGGGPLLFTPLLVFVIWFRGRNPNPQ